MTHAEELPRILVLGGSGVGKHSLLAVIREEGEVHRGRAAYPWRLDTKYYTADVQFEVRRVDHCGPLQLGSAGYEAVVLVFDAGRQASFDSVQRWYEAAGGEEAELGVKLAVATRAGAGSESAKPAWLQAAEEWCADQLVEYVELESDGQLSVAGSELAAAAAAVAAPAGSREEGATGVQRIKEALAAHMWPGLQLKPAPRHGAAAAAMAQQELDADLAVEQAVPHAAAAAANGVAPAAAANGSGSSEPPEQFSFSDYVRAPEGAAAAAAAAAAGPAGSSEEQEVEQLEQLFAQLSGHRDRLAQLPDSQRREAAAAMVMQLMAAMGLDEEGDLDEEGSEGEE